MWGKVGDWLEVTWINNNTKKNDDDDDDELLA